MKTLLLTLSVILATAVPSLLGQAPDGEQDAQAIKAAVAELVSIRKLKNPEERGAALKQAAKPDHSKVAHALAPFLKDRGRVVVNAALASLRYMKNEGALEELLKFARRRNVTKDPDLYKAALLAVGQHGSKKALPVLADDLWGPAAAGLFNIRVLSIAHIREKESVDTLIRLMRMGKSGARKKAGLSGAQRIIAHGLFALTGHKIEKGTPVEWKKWWASNRKSIEIAKTPSGLTEKESKRWLRMWTSPEDRKRQEKEKKEDRRRRKQKQRKKEKGN